MSTSSLFSVIYDMFFKLFYQFWTWAEVFEENPQEDVAMENSDLKESGRFFISVSSMVKTVMEPTLVLITVPDQVGSTDLEN